MKKHTNHNKITPANVSKALFGTLLLAGLVHVDAAQAAILNTGDLLTITSGATTSSGSYSGVGSFFAMDQNVDSTISPGEKIPIQVAASGVIVIGTTQFASGSHSGAINGSESPAFDIWNYFSNTGMDYTTVAPTGGTTNGLNFSGWTITWNYLASIPMGTGAWQPLNCSDLGCTGHTFTNGNAWFRWDGVYGDGYTLDYAATVPQGDPSGFGNVPYYLHLEGVVQAVPIPAAAWLFGSGLMGLFGMARRRRM